MTSKISSMNFVKNTNVWSWTVDLGGAQILMKIIEIILSVKSSTWTRMNDQKQWVAYRFLCSIFTLRTTSFWFVHTSFSRQWQVMALSLEHGVCVSEAWIDTVGISKLFIWNGCSLRGQMHFGITYELHQFVCPHYVSIFFWTAGALCITWHQHGRWPHVWLCCCVKHRLP